MAVESEVPRRVELNGFSPELDLKPLDDLIMDSIEKARVIEGEGKFYIPGNLEASDIFTEEAHLYLILVRRTLELAFPLAKEEELAIRASDLLDHENDHAAAALMLDKEVFYAVQIRKTIQPDGTKLPAIWGAIVHRNKDGSETVPEELEIITSAPKNLSDRDVEALGALGTSGLMLDV